jgi:hypothetical protein
MPNAPRTVVFQAASTGIFSKHPDSRHPQQRKGKDSNPHQQRGPPSEPPRPQQQPKPNQRHDQFQHHPPRSRHQAGKEAGNPVSTYSVNATDFDGDDTMTGHGFSRNRGKKRQSKGHNRNRSAGADQPRSRPDGRDYANKRPRGSSHSPAPNWNRKKGKKSTAWYDDLDRGNSSYDGKSKKKDPKSSSQNQSGSKNVIVRVDTADTKGTYILDKSNLIKNQNVKPTYVIGDPRTEN